MKAIVVLVLILSVAVCYVTNGYDTNIASTSYFTSGSSYDCDVGVNGDLVGFYCPSKKYLFYYKKTDFLSNNLSNGLTKDISYYSNTATQHRGISWWIVTASFSSSAHFTLGTYSGGIISSVHYYIRGFSPVDLAFNGGLFVDVSVYGSTYYWMVGLLNTPSYTTVNYITRGNPKGIAIRDLVPNSTGVLY